MKKINLSFPFWICLLIIPLLAKTNPLDSDQPIDIISNSQSIDLEKNIVTFSDNVVITQGTMKINASNVDIYRPNNNEQQDRIVAKGSPVTFQQRLADGQLAHASANQVDYLVTEQLLILTGNAKLKKQDSSMQADKIIYDVKKQKLIASSNKSNRIRTILYPNQLNKK